MAVEAKTIICHGNNRRIGERVFMPINPYILDEKISPTGKTQYLVLCPSCGKERWVGGIKVRVAIEKGYFTGLCNQCSKTGKNNPIYHNGRFIHKGYMKVLISELTEFERTLVSQMKHQPRYIDEHRLVMAVKLNRPLHDNEIIHHVDGNKLNNCPDNLLVASRGKHTDEYYTLLYKVALLEKENTELKKKVRRLETNGY